MGHPTSRAAHAAVHTAAGARHALPSESMPRLPSAGLVMRGPRQEEAEDATTAYGESHECAAAAAASGHGWRCGETSRSLNSSRARRGG